MSRFLKEEYKALAPYTPGEQPQDKKYIKLNTNESPFQPSNYAIALAADEVKKSQLYPDPDATRLIEEIAKEYGVEKKNVIVTNGSDEVLNFAFMAYCDEETPAVFPDITYGFYKVFADINRVPSKVIPLKENLTVDIDEYINTYGTVFIANPNAPTGIALPTREIERLLQADRDRIVVIDEAYVDFGAESAVSLTEKYDNLLVTMTFSKSRSMAGARLGFGIGSTAIIEDLNRIKYSTNPYNVNRITAAMGIGAISDKEYFQKNVNEIIKNREFTKGELLNLGFDLTPSCANFIFAKSADILGEKLYLELKARGILVRHFKSPRISDYVRITVGNLEQMQILIYKIKEILEENKNENS